VVEEKKKGGFPGEPGEDRKKGKSRCGAHKDTHRGCRIEYQRSHEESPLEERSVLFCREKKGKGEKLENQSVSQGRRGGRDHQNISRGVQKKESREEGRNYDTGSSTVTFRGNCRDNWGNKSEKRTREGRKSPSESWPRQAGGSRDKENNTLNIIFGQRRVVKR